MVIVAERYWNRRELGDITIGGFLGSLLLPRDALAQGGKPKKDYECSTPAATAQSFSEGVKDGNLDGLLEIVANDFCLYGEPGNDIKGQLLALLFIAAAYEWRVAGVDVQRKLQKPEVVVYKQPIPETDRKFIGLRFPSYDLGVFDKAGNAAADASFNYTVEADSKLVVSYAIDTFIHLVKQGDRWLVSSISPPSTRFT